jgi:transposase
MDVPLTSADLVILTDEERRLLTQRANAARAPHRDVVRARIVLAAADDVANAQIARDLRICEDTARRWRRRFCVQRLDGLKDRARSGRPPSFTAVG